MAWQPIETAPKDGDTIFAISDHAGLVAVRWEQVDERDAMKGFSDGWYDMGTFQHWPTHWMRPDMPEAF
jgi:hypothetical protein